MMKIRVSLGFQHGFLVPSEGRSGGIALLWRDSEKISIQNYSKYHIDAVVEDGNGSPHWRITGFYGHPETALRQKSWELLELLKSKSDLPWVCLGDFNEIMEGREKEGRGGKERHQAQMAKFRAVVNHYAFKDMGFLGPVFTWCNQQLGRARVLERLDKTLAMMDLMDLFPCARVHNWVDFKSNHCGLILTDQQRCNRRQS
jgi:hypothetical protein